MNYLTNIWLIIFYYIPVVAAAIGYFFKTLNKYQDDVRRRNENKYYHSDTIGTLIGRGIVIIFPIVNIFALVFDLNILGSLFSTLSKIFNQPLVPEKKDGE